MSGFKRYPAYKDSGVEWLGDVPVGWVKGSLKHMAWIRNGKDHKEAESPDGAYPVIGSGGQFSKASRYLYDGESVLLGRKGTIDKPLYITGRFWTVDTMFYTEVSKAASARFLYYYALTIPFGFYSTSTALPSMTQGDLLNHPAAIPSLFEQTQIARFLDHETARIDALIEEQQRLIELLKEKRQAVISHAVTKGLDPTVPMKDSGVEWLGEVPAHWGLTRIGWQCMVGNGCTPARDNQSYWYDGHYPWLNSSKVNLERVVEADQFVTSQALKECALPIVKPGSVLMAITGEGKTRGMVTITEIEATINQHVAFIEPRGSELRPAFLHDWLSANYSRLRHDSADWGSTKAAITCSDIRAYPLPLPPLAEQEAICQFIDSKSSLIDRLISSADENVSLLQERRSALISAAVTGKIDVRNWQPPVSARAPKLEEAEAV